MRKLATQDEMLAAWRERIPPEERARFDQGTLAAQAGAAVFMFGITLRDIRLERGLTQMQLSELTGIQQREITRIENGNGNPTLKTMQKLLVALGQTLIVATDPKPAKLSKRAKAN